MRSLILLPLLCGCLGYQSEPYAEVQYRQELLGDTAYGGQTLMVGVRYVPPTRISHITRGMFDLRMPEPPVEVNVTHAAEEPGGVEEIVEAASQLDLTWPTVAGLVVLAWFYREWRRSNGGPRSPKSDTPPASTPA